jgi:LmbE family N-acetylglucosaminyl deacetylase
VNVASFGSVRRILAVGCHSDDLEIGCGGTILTLTRSIPGLEIDWVVLAAHGARADEARASAEELLADAGTVRIEIHPFRDGFLPYAGREVKEIFEELKGKVDPQLVFTHTRDDLHQDHRLACELTWNTFRNHVILEYEIPKFDGDLGRPNAFFPLTESVVQEKIALLHRHFATQAGKGWFDEDTSRGLLRLRGMEANAAERFAEAYTCRKIVLGA